MIDSEISGGIDRQTPIAALNSIKRFIDIYINHRNDSEDFFMFVLP